MCLSASKKIWENEKSTLWIRTSALWWPRFWHFSDLWCSVSMSFLSFKSLNLNPPTFNYFKLHTNPFYKQMNVQFTTDTFRTWNQSISIHFIIQLPNCTTKKVKYIHKNKKYTAFYNTKKTVHGIEYVHNWENHASIDTYSSLSW